MGQPWFLCSVHDKNSKKIRNWSDYNKSLVKRGQLLLSFSSNYIDQFYYQAFQSKGGQKFYTSEMYEFLMNIKVCFRLPWRATIKFAQTLLQKTFPKQCLQVPDQWKKIHMAVDLNSMQIVSMAYTESGVNDCEVVFKKVLKRPVLSQQSSLRYKLIRHDH